MAQENPIANHKRNQAPVAGFEFDGSHHNGLHAVTSPECRFDLSQLDAKAANLYLVINPPEKVEAAVRKLDSKIATLVDPGLRIAGKRIGQEVRLGKLVPMEVTEPHARSADVHFADRTLGDRLKVLIEKVNSDIRQWMADCNLVNIDIDLCPGSADRRFGGPVLVPHRAACSGQGLSKAQGKNLSSHDNLHPRVALPSSFQQESIHCRRTEDHSRRRTTNLLYPRATFIDRLLLNQIQTGAESQGQIDLQARHVKRDCGPGEHNVIRTQLQVLANATDRIRDASMGDSCPLRLARRTGRIDHVSETVRGNRTFPVARSFSASAEVIHIEQMKIESLRAGNSAKKRSAGKHKMRSGVVQH